MACCRKSPPLEKFITSVGIGKSVELLEPFSTHMLHVWSVKTNIWMIFWGNGGKYTIHEAFAQEQMSFPAVSRSPESPIDFPSLKNDARSL